MITIPPMLTLSQHLPFIIHSTLHHHVPLLTNFLQTTTTPHNHRITRRQLHADNHMPHPFLCATLITNHHPHWTILKLLVLTHCRRYCEMFRGGDGAEAGADMCEP